MTNLFSRISVANQEDITTEVLAYLLQKFDSSIPAFLSLIAPSASPLNCEVMTQCGIVEGRPDLVAHDKNGQWIVLIENKPWNGSSFTTIHEEGDQLRRYATHLKKCDFQKRILCLLATESNKDKLIQASNIASDDKIIFAIITWEQVFDKLEEHYQKNTTESFLLRELRGYVFPPSVTIPPEVLQDEGKIRENWDMMKMVVKQAKDIAKANPELSNYVFSDRPGLNPKPNDETLNFYGYYINDKVSDLTYFVTADMAARRFLGTLGKQSLFVLQVRFKEYQNGLSSFHNRTSGVDVITPEILTQCGFEHEKSPRPDRTWGCEYVFPLADPSDDHAIRPEELAETLSKILKKTNFAINGDKTKNNL